MLSFQDVRAAYPNGRVVFDGLSLNISEGQRVVIAGKSGSGKTTLLRLAAGLLEPSQGIVDREGNGPVGFVRQQPENQLVAGTVREEIAFALEYAGLETETLRQRVAWALSETGLTELADRTPERLSGGQMQRVAIAAALALKPTLWLLDEPTSFLDADGRARIHRVIKALPPDATMLMTASDAEEYTIGTRLVVLANNNVAADGPPDRLLKDGILPEWDLEEPRSWSLTHLEKRTIVPVAKGSRKSTILPEDAAINVTELHSGPKAAMPLMATGVTASRKEFLGPARKALDDVNLKAEPGEVIALVGPGGAGKSSLLEVLAGLLDLEKGSVRWGDVSPENLRGRIGIAFQFPERSFFAESVLAEVAYGARNQGFSASEAESRAKTALKLLGFLEEESFLQRSPFELSGGEARRVALAAVAALHPAAWLLDEPTAGLDAGDAKVVGRLIQTEAARGCVVVVAGHDVNRFADWTDRWVVLDEGKIVFDGHPGTAWAGDGLPAYPREPATVSVWKSKGLKVENMPGLSYDFVAHALGRT
ncbi:MAG: ATP-binding cassette domain-containing protein [bacterium]